MHVQRMARPPAHVLRGSSLRQRMRLVPAGLEIRV